MKKSEFDEGDKVVARLFGNKEEEVTVTYKLPVGSWVQVEDSLGDKHWIRCRDIRAKV